VLALGSAHRRYDLNTLKLKCSALSLCAATALPILCRLVERVAAPVKTLIASLGIGHGLFTAAPLSWDILIPGTVAVHFQTWRPQALDKGIRSRDIPSAITLGGRPLGGCFLANTGQ
jgi:hypothetical protein